MLIVAGSALRSEEIALNMAPSSPRATSFPWRVFRLQFEPVRCEEPHREAADAIRIKAQASNRWPFVAQPQGEQRDRVGLTDDVILAAEEPVGIRGRLVYGVG